jgi:hypothetical protein
MHVQGLCSYDAFRIEYNLLELQLPRPHLLVTHRVYFTGSLYGISFRVLYLDNLFGTIVLILSIYI